MSDSGRQNVPVDRPWWLPPIGSVHWAWWLLVGSLMATIDFVTGPHLEFPAIYVLPATLSAWYSGRWPAVALAVGLPGSRLWFTLQFWHTPVNLTNALTRIGVFLVIALVFDRFAEHEKKLEREIRVLEGMLPICSVCKSIRDAKGEWQPLEHYIQNRSEATFTHGLCPVCIDKHYG